MKCAECLEEKCEKCGTVINNIPAIGSGISNVCNHLAIQRFGYGYGYNYGYGYIYSYQYLGKYCQYCGMAMGW